MINREEFILSNNEGNCYHFTTNRYRLIDEAPRCRRLPSDRPITLVLAHGLGCHKETWEPFIEDLKLMQGSNALLRENGIVTEAWSVECPSHGDSATLNERLLVHDAQFDTCEEYARSIMTLIISPIFRSDRSRRIVLVGHSGAASCVAFVMEKCFRRWGVQKTPFHSFIIIECPVLATPLSPLRERNENWINISSTLARLTKKRRDKWNSARDAYDWLRIRSPYCDWDPRALRRYVEFGLRSLPTAFYPNETTGVTLSCHKKFEAKPFEEQDKMMMAGAILRELHSLFNVHLIFGCLSPFRPPDDDIPLLTAQSGSDSFYTSVTGIPHAGHLVIQEAPRLVAKAVLGAMCAARVQDATGIIKLASVL